MYKILLTILTTSLFLCSTGCLFGQELLPEEIPADLNIVLTENGGANSFRSISIDAENIKFGSGSGWHSHKKTKREIPPQVVEKLYRILQENQFDRIKSESAYDFSPQVRNGAIMVFYNKKSIIVFEGTFPERNRERFERVWKAILETAEMYQTGN
jgi:hypothetical protein